MHVYILTICRFCVYVNICMYIIYYIYTTYTHTKNIFIHRSIFHTNIPQNNLQVFPQILIPQDSPQHSQVIAATWSSQLLDIPRLPPVLAPSCTFCAWAVTSRAASPSTSSSIDIAATVSTLLASATRRAVSHCVAA